MSRRSAKWMTKKLRRKGKRKGPPGKPKPVYYPNNPLINRVRLGAKLKWKSDIIENGSIQQPEQPKPKVIIRKRSDTI